MSLRLIKTEFVIDRTYRPPLFSPVERAFWVGMAIGAGAGAFAAWLLL